jgi:hypothetical protein
VVNDYFSVRITCFGQASQVKHDFQEFAVIGLLAEQLPDVRRQDIEQGV